MNQQSRFIRSLGDICYVMRSKFRHVSRAPRYTVDVRGLSISKRMYLVRISRK